MAELFLGEDILSPISSSMRQIFSTQRKIVTQISTKHSCSFGRINYVRKCYCTCKKVAAQTASQTIKKVVMPAQVKLLLNRSGFKFKKGRTKMYVLKLYKLGNLGLCRLRTELISFGFLCSYKNSLSVVVQIDAAKRLRDHAGIDRKGASVKRRSASAQFKSQEGYFLP